MADGSFVIGPWLVKPSNNLLINNELERKVEPKVMKLLVYLASANGQVVSRNELLDAVWQQIVLDDALTNTIAQLRKALGDIGSPKQFIETIPKQGYRLIPSVQLPTAHSSTEKNNSRFDNNHFDNNLSINVESKLNNRADENSRLQKRRQSDQSSQVKQNGRSKRFFISIGLFVVILIIGKLIYQQTSVIEKEKTAFSKTVAVLPFDVYSNQTEVSFFSSGLTEELIHQLAANPELQVIARTSSSKFKDSDIGVEAISKILNARYIIQGSVRQIDDSLRITVQLIDAKKGFHLWSKAFDNKMDDLFLDTQIAIGKKISLLITNKKDSEQTYNKRQHPRSADAYRLFLLAQSHMKISQVSHYEKALGYYKQAVEKAPNYAIAYSGMAAAHLLIYQYKHTSLEETNRVVSKLLQQSISIEPNLAEAFAVRGLLNTYLKNYRQAEKDYLKALKLNPGLRFARHNYGYLLWILSRSKDALIQFKIALELDPLSGVTNFGVGDTLSKLGEIDKAIDHFETCQELLPSNYYCFLGLSSIYGLVGNIEKYHEYLDKSEKLAKADNFWILSSNASYQLQLGHTLKADQILKKAGAKNATDYQLLKLEYLLALKLGDVKIIVSKLKTLSLDNPNDNELNNLLGMAAYFDKDCRFSNIQYQKSKQENPESMLEIWDFAEGISHQLNFAYCNQQRNQMDRANELLEAYQQFATSLPLGKHQIPGEIFSQARYLALIGKTQQAKLQLRKIQDWPFYWITKKDPILKSLVTN